MMDTKNPAPTGVGNGAEFDSVGTQNLVPLNTDRNTCDLARIPGEARIRTPRITSGYPAPKNRDLHDEMLMATSAAKRFGGIGTVCRALGVSENGGPNRRHRWLKPNLDIRSSL